jgi:hypothetical protein
MSASLVITGETEPDDQGEPRERRRPPAPVRPDGLLDIGRRRELRLAAPPLAAVVGPEQCADGATPSSLQSNVIASSSRVSPGAWRSRSSRIRSR